MKKLFFLSGLPRSGSTLLGSILNQNPDIHTTPTSPLSDLLCYIDESFSKLKTQYTYDDILMGNTYASILHNFYRHIDSPYVIDKHRAWARNITPLKMFYSENPKIICTNRSIAEILSSYILLIDKNKEEKNFVDEHLKNNNIEISIENRTETLWRSYVSDPYESFVFGLTHFRENIHIVNYDDLIDQPQNTMNEVYNFLEIDSFDHDFNNIPETLNEDKDLNGWGIKDLHKIRSKLERTSPPAEEVIGELGAKLYNSFNINL